jgi:hypothetical protein
LVIDQKLEKENKNNLVYAIYNYSRVYVYMKTKRRRQKGSGNCGSQGCPAPVPVQKPVLVPSPIKSPVVKKTINQDVYIAGLITKVKEGNELVGEDLENYNVYLQKKAINDEKLKAEKIAKALLYPTKADQVAREQAAKEQAAREQAAREQAAREQAAREQAAREQAAREQAAREQAAKEQEQAAKEQEQAAREQAAKEKIADYNRQNPSRSDKTIKKAFTPKNGGKSKKTHKRKPRRSK